MRNELLEIDYRWNSQHLLLYWASSPFYPFSLCAAATAKTTANKTRCTSKLIQKSILWPLKSFTSHTFCSLKKRNNTWMFILIVPEEMVVNWDLFSQALPNITCSSTRHEDVPRKNDCNSSISDPLGRQQRISSSWYPGFVGKWVNPYPDSTDLPYSSNSQTCITIRGHPCILAAAKWTSMGWFQSWQPSSSNAAYCVWLVSSPARNDQDFPHSRYLWIWGRS